MFKNSHVQGFILASTLCLLNTGVLAGDKNLTPEKALEFSHLAHKENLTTGFFQCAIRYPEHLQSYKCIPAELKFQNHVLDTVVNTYSGLLSKTQLADFQKVQKSFVTFRETRCDWYNQTNLRKNTRLTDVNSLDTLKLECLLEATVNRRMEIESLIPESEQ